MKVGLCTGCFDNLHYGHRFFLHAAKRQCDYLVVAVNTDSWCREHKGPGRPKDPLSWRMIRVSQSLYKIGGGHDNAVIPFDGDNEMLALCIRPDVIFRGWDQCETESAFPIIRIAKGPDVSTTSLAQRSTK